LTAKQNLRDGKTFPPAWREPDTKRQAPSLKEIEADIGSFFEDYVSEEHADLYVSWDDSKKNPGESEGPGYVCDLVFELMGYVWRHPYDYATKRQRRLLNCYWDRAMFEEYDAIREAIVERWESPVSCCIRAGIDFAYQVNA
jgi:hypothetical protein